MGTMPDVNQLLSQWWGGYYEQTQNIVAALNYVAPGGNPPWGVNEFLAVRSKFGGAALSPPPEATLTLGSSVVAVNVATSLLPGLWVSDAARGIPPATSLLAVGTYALTLSAPAVATAVNDVLLNATGGVLSPTLQTTEGSDVVIVSSIAGLSVSEAVFDAAKALAPGSTIASIGSLSPLSLVMSNPAQLNAAGDALTIYNLPVVPLPALVAYINLAQASLAYGRWMEQWYLGMELFVAHFCTLYLQAEGNPGVTAGQVAASGLEHGIMLSRSAGDVSASSQLVSGLEDWAAWTETRYGTQFATLAKIAGMGMVLLW